MKKVFLSLLAMTFAAISFTSCEDVPAPYLIFNGEDTPEAGTYLSESFASDFGSFTPVAVNADGLSWQIRSFSSGSWAVGSGYDNSARVNKESEAYLVSSDIDLSQSSEAFLQFEYVLTYANNPGEDKVFITDNYTDDPTTTTWEDITGTLTKSADFTSHTYKQNITSQYIGKSNVRIAFYFTGENSGSKTWEIKDVLVKEGTAESGEGPIAENTWKVVTSITDGDYIIAARVSGNDFAVATPIAGTKTYGYLTVASTTLTDKSVITSDNANLFTFTKEGRGYTIKDSFGRYLISDISRTNFNVSDTQPTQGNDHLWEVSFDDNGAVIIKSIGTGKIIQYSRAYTSYGEYDAGNNTTPYLFNAAGDGSVIPDDTVTPEPEPTPTPSGNNLLVNGDFESWTGGLPDHWKSASTAGNATLSQSTSAHGGTYAVEATVTASGNKRMAYEEIALKAGTYNVNFFVKAASSEGASINKGYVPVVNGAVGSYSYDGYVNDITTEWQEVSYSFTLQSESTVCLVVMIPKNSKSNVIIDDFSLTTSDGGLVGGDDPNPQPSNTLSFDFKANGLSGWSIVDVNLPSALSYIWSYDTRYGIKASAFANQTNYDSESWLISPALDLSNLSPVVGHSLSISHAANYFANSVSDECQVLVSTDANAPTNPTAVNWIQLNVSAWPTSWTFVDATADLTSVIGQSTVFVAFKYTSTATKAGTWEISKASIE